MKRAELSPSEVTDLCDAGAAAREALGPRQRVARFEWRGRRYRAVRSIFGLQVQSGDGRRLVAQRYD